MKTTVLVFHPHINQSNCNIASAKKAVAANVEVSYLYDLYPDGHIDVATEQSVLMQADRMVLQFPLFSPALLKQWQDDVLTYGWAYAGGNKLHGKELVLAVSAGADTQTYGRGHYYQYTPEELLRPFQATARLIGMKYIKPFITMNSMSLSTEQYVQRATEYLSYITSPDALPIFGDFDI